MGRQGQRTPYPLTFYRENEREREVGETAGREREREWERGAERER